MMPLQGSLSIERMCQLAQVSRAGFYRSLQSHRPRRGDGGAVHDSGDRGRASSGAMATGGSAQE